MSRNRNFAQTAVSSSQTKSEMELEKSYRLSEEYSALWRERSKFMFDHTPQGVARYDAARKRMNQIDEMRERQEIESTRRLYANRPDLLRAYERHLVRMKALETDK